LQSTTSVPKIYISTSHGVTGKGNNFHNLFIEAKRLQAKAVVVVDADLQSITPDWIYELASPILGNRVDYVTPLYSRNEYDGTITNNICYPLIYGLLGKNIRQPIGGDFAFSGRVGNYYLKQHWDKTTKQYGIDIFMTLNAITGGFRIGQIGLGAKIHKPSAPKLGAMFTQVVGTLFNSLLKNKYIWTSTNKVSSIPYFGKNTLATPQNLSIDYKNTKAMACKEFRINKMTLKNNLPSPLFQKLNTMFENGNIRIGVGLWTEIIYDLLYAYHNTKETDTLVEAIKSLYFGRVITFIKQTLDLDHFSSEKLIQKQAKYFFKKRKYLINKFYQIIEKNPN
jgi:hypothetical protein